MVLVAGDNGAGSQAEARVAELLAGVEPAVAKGHLKTAERLADAALRRVPDSPELLRMVGEILLAAGNPQGALRKLERASALRSDPGVEASIILALLAADRGAAAASRLEAALKAFAVERGDRLASAASRVLVALSGQVAGWTGLTQGLEVWGGALDQARSSLSGGDAEPPRSPARLIGVDPAFRPDFKLDGRCSRQGTLAQGWARLGWAPRYGPKLLVADSEGQEIEVPTVLDAAGRHAFILDLREAGLQGLELKVSAVLPDGARATLPGAPLLTQLPRHPGRALPPGPNDPCAPGGST